MHAIARGVLVAGLLVAAREVRAAESCRPASQPGFRLCEVGIPVERLQHVAASQQASEWCWAASIEMVFRYYGHDVAQSRIVQTVYGAPVNAPAFSGGVITGALNRAWVDEQGRAFQSSANAYDVQAGALGMSNADIAQELRDEHPLIVGTQSHAMLVTALQYLSPPGGGVGQVVGVTVRDPWPGQGKRQLGLQELRPFYVARVRLAESPSQTTTVQHPEVIVASGSGGCTSNADCKGGRTCQAGHCVGAVNPPCAKDTDCPGNQVCENATCTSPGSGSNPGPRGSQGGGQTNGNTANNAAAEREARRQRCLSDCDSEEARCERHLTPAADCLHDRIERCIDACTGRYGYPENQCRSQMCAPGVGLNADWQPECDRDYRDGQRDCLDSRDTCRSSCN